MEVKDLSSLALAYYGDALYEVFIRERVIRLGASPKVDVLNKANCNHVAF